MPRTVLVTGAAGFIGAPYRFDCSSVVIGFSASTTSTTTTTQASSRRGCFRSKPWPLQARRFERLALEDADALMALFAAENPAVVVNLAAQAGVRYSGESCRLHPEQSGGFWSFAGRVPPPWH